MIERVAVYLFRDPHFAPAGNTIVSAAPLEAVVKVFGGGGIKETGGLSKAFGGAAVFKDDATGTCHLAVWGARKAANFRSALRRCGLEIEIIKSPPPGKLAWYQSN